jgi:hypothetical protein
MARLGKEKVMRYNYALGVTLAISGATTTASAAFTGFQVQYLGFNSSQGVDVYWVFANFSQSDDVIVGLNGFQAVEGSTSGIRHNDNTGLQGGNAWDPKYTVSSQSGSTDSFVTINGVTGSNSVTSISGFGSGSGIANGASWSTTGPLSEVGGGFRVRIAQFAGHFGNGGGFLASLNIHYRDSMSSTTTMSGFGTFLIGGVVPGPGALALLAISGLARSRRR